MKGRSVSTAQLLSRRWHGEQGASASWGQLGAHARPRRRHDQGQPGRGVAPHKCRPPGRGDAALCCQASGFNLPGLICRRHAHACLQGPDHGTTGGGARAALPAHAAPPLRSRSPGRDLQILGTAVLLDDQRVVPRRLEGVIQPSQQAAVSVEHRRRLPVHHAAGGAHHLAAKHLPAGKGRARWGLCLFTCGTWRVRAERSAPARGAGGCAFSAAERARASAAGWVRAQGTCGRSGRLPG